MNNYQSFIPLIEKKSLVSDPEKFQEIINVTFHKYEYEWYDKLHLEMWQSLPYQYNLIAEDTETIIAGKKNLRLLDIGCGTGLAADMLLTTSIGSSVSEVHLLDTSAEMLKKAAVKAKKWGKKIKLITGDIKQVYEQYDLIIISSVLHHIPDLVQFLNNVDQIQSPGGILITIHDPAEEALKSELYKQRCEEYILHIKKNHSQSKKKLFVRAYNKIRSLFKQQNYIDNINRDLLRKKIIKEPLTSHELWSVTDIHVGNGIGKGLMIEALNNYELISYRTYAFFGELSSNLDPLYQKKEQELILSKDLFGRNFSSVWIKK